MSHFNSSSTGGSWQSQRNTQAANQSQEMGSNLSGLFNSSAAANLLAQFSSLGNVNINNLAANLPAIVAATNTNQGTSNSAQNNQNSSSNNSGYQWHSQNRLATQNTNSSSNSNQSYLLGPGGTMSNSFNSVKNQSNQKSQSYDSRNESKNKSSNYSKVSNYSNSSSRDRPTPNRYQNQSTTKFDSSSPGNNQSAQIQGVLPNLTQNPLLAQALLTQLAQTAQQNQTNLVSALAAAVTNNNLNQTLAKQSRSRSKSKVRSRSRSRSRESSQRVRNGRLNRNDSCRDTRRVQNSSRSKSPANLAKRLSYSMSKGRDSRENKDRENINPGTRDLVKDTKPESKESAKEIKETKIRYSIKLPKLPIDTVYNNVCTLKHRYPLLYVPSDYIDSKNTWLKTFSLSKPFKLNNKCNFHIMNKDALPLSRNSSQYDPSDLDYKWQVKVMLLSMPSPDDFLKRCCSLADDNLKEHRCEPPAKVIQFLIGNKGKHELMALGGPWSPSLDGPNPATNTQTLINTAVRTVKALTGIDLSPCNQWYRFLDIQFNRNEEFKTKNDDASEEESLILDDEKYVENTVIFVPNVWSIMPTNVEYQKQVEEYQNLIEKEPDWINEPLKEEQIKACNGDDSSKAIKAENDAQMEAKSDAEANVTSNCINNDEIKEPTHYSKLDLKKMKVDELRSELGARHLDSKGLKQQLVNKLKDALEAEKAQDGIDVSIDPKEASFLDDAIDFSQQSLIMDEEKKDSKEEKKTAQPYTWSKLTKSEREKVYSLPVTPHIIVHPSPTFKQNKFECQLVSLSHLLDYRKDDNKECSFEVFLFAECFHEMLLRDNAFHVYKHILSLREDLDKTNTSGKRKLSEDESCLDAKKTKTDEENSKKTEEPKQDKTFRPKTLFPELLFSFTYIDSNRSNYISDKDLEDLFYLIGLNLSRSKCKALLKKLNIRDGLFNYRTLTDRSISGINSFFKIPNDDQIINNIISFDSYLNRCDSKSESSSDQTNQTVVEINGSTIDVLTTIKKLQKCEESLNEIDLKYKQTLDELDRVKVLNRTLDRHKQKLVDEASELKKKLRDEQKFSKDSDDKYLRMKDCLYRTKTQLNKVLDDISDTTRRSHKSSDLSGKSARADSDKKESESKDGKKSEEEIKNLNENSQDNGYQDASNEQVKMDEIKSEQSALVDDEIIKKAKQNSNENEPSQGEMLEISSNEKTNDFDP